MLLTQNVPQIWVCDGIVVSNHGGRQLGSAVSPIEVLLEITQAVGDRMVVLVEVDSDAEPML